MKKFPLFSIILSIVLTVNVFCVRASAEDRPEVQFGCSTLQARQPLAGTEALLPSADGVILFELNTKTMVYAYEPDARVNPSSMVKIMSALVALENGKLDDVITVQRSTLDSVPIGSVSAGLLREEEVTLHDLLYCCLVASANDATAVMAEHIAGSQEAFVDMMNEKARELGCRDTLFSNVNGLNDNIQYSTARDLAVITASALENEVFAEIFGTVRYTMPATNLSEERIIYTTNYTMSEDKVKGYLDERVTGGKTAAATHTKRSLICTAEIGTARYLSVVMSADSVMTEDNISVISFGSFKETELLLDHAQENYEVRQILDDSQAFSQHPILDGANDVVVSPKQDVFSVLPIVYEDADLQFITDVQVAGLSAPISAGRELGTVRVSYRGIILAECPIASMFDVAKANTVITPAAPIDPDEQETPVKGILKWILLGIVALVVLALIVLLSIRLIRNARIRDRHRKRKRNRRRSR